MGKNIIIILILLIGLGGLLFWQASRQQVLVEPQISQSSLTGTKQFDQEISPSASKNSVGAQTQKRRVSMDGTRYDSVESKKIMITDGVKHSVPLDEIIGGGPPKDGIPSIDNPKFISFQEANKTLPDNEPGIALEIGSVSRFYPFQILVWHEIVNDIVGGKQALITYCPLCLSGIVFDPLVNGERVEFGTSGKLWNSNLVMYDRKTDSLWSQILGEAIMGEQTGKQLAVLPSDQIRFGEWKKLHPNGEVLSRDTGAERFYGQDPYGDYYTTPGTFFPVGKQDSRLPEKEFILGIVINGKAKAYWPPAVKKTGKIEDVFQGKTIVAEYEKNIDAVRLFEKKSNGTLERINPFGAFWFSWAAAHPDTELYK
ncbi:MAG: DUF3179 domain-containing protein [Candidatus Magasanikbacteria bacterium]|nr:DUF3179 domain-containing protein [Candidatus Magasanikbacteria bacterium]